MKILGGNRLVQEIEGKICDKCGYRVRRGDPTTADDRTAVARGMELGRFVTIDIEQMGTVHRADLCAACAELALDALRPALLSFRKVAEPYRGGPGRTYNYRAVDAETGGVFEVSSMFDETD